MSSISRQINNNAIEHMIGPIGINETNDASGLGLIIGPTGIGGTGSKMVGGTGTIKNKWTRDQEELLAKWADKALCYRWLHDLSERKFNSLNNRIQIPVIVLSTLTGAVNVGINSIFPPNLAVYGSFGLGAISISTGILTTIGNFLRFAQNMEGHRVASLQWAKFHRNISAELAIHPDQRQDSIEFFTIKRAELDRLVESSPQIPTDIIQKFENKFRDVDIDKPEICDILEPTYIYVPGKKRVKIINKKKTFSEKFFSAFSSPKPKDSSRDTSKEHGDIDISGSGENNSHNDIHTDEDTVITFNNDSNKGSPKTKSLGSPQTFAAAAANATLTFTNHHNDDEDDIEKGLERILHNSKKEKNKEQSMEKETSMYKETSKEKENKDDSELSNKLHASILESLNR
jgi:hypothetical protein